MKQMLRSTWLWCAIGAVSIAALWGRSYLVGDNVFLFGHGGRVQGVASLNGSTCWLFSNVPAGRTHAWTCWHYAQPARLEDVSIRPESEVERMLGEVRDPSWSGVGFEMSRVGLDGRFGASSGGGLILRVPHWFWLALLSATPLRHAWRHRRSVRYAERGRCRTCGYDLRATPLRCPECGTAPAEG